MRYTFMESGTPHEVEVLKTGKGYRVTVDGTAAAVELQWVSARRAVLVIGERRVVVHALRDGPSRYVMLEGATFRFEKEGPGGDAVIETLTRYAPGVYELKSPMPGRVVSMSARAGETVERNDALVTLEAMKMENNVLAPWDARVLEVLVKPGDLVEGGMPLLRFEVEAE